MTSISGKAKYSLYFPIQFLFSHIHETAHSPLLLVHHDTWERDLSHSDFSVQRSCCCSISFMHLRTEKGLNTSEKYYQGSQKISSSMSFIFFLSASFHSIPFSAMQLAIEHAVIYPRNCVPYTLIISAYYG